MQLAVFTLCAVLVAASRGVAGADAYPPAYNNIDIDKILANDRLVTAYTNCLVDKGPCSPDGSALKKALPEALSTNCAKCTERQKKGGEKVIRFMIKNKPELWKQIVQKYDPDGSFTKKFSS